MDDNNVDEFSRLEAGFAQLEIEPRPISVQGEVLNRHTKILEHVANDLDFDYHVNRDNLPSNPCYSLQGVLSALHYNSHITNLNNFDNKTNIECFMQTDKQAAFSTLDDAGLDELLNTVKQEAPDVGTHDISSIAPKTTSSTSQLSKSTQTAQEPSESRNTQEPITGPCDTITETACPSTDLSPEMNACSSPETGTNPTPETDTRGRLLIIFVPLTAQKGSSFGSKASMTRSCVQKLVEVIGMNPEYLLNLLGRPDYWSPRVRWQHDKRDELMAVGMGKPVISLIAASGVNQITDYFCQLPRWNLQVHDAPLSVYMIRRLKADLTVYIISHKTGDTIVHALQQILKAGIHLLSKNNRQSDYLRNPLEVAVLLSSLSLEASKYHVGRFRRYMWKQVNKVDDHLAGLETSDRGRLTELTKSLQIISQQADSHLVNAEVAILTAKGTRDIQARLHEYLSTPTAFRQPAEDAIKYVINSMEKQKTLFLNYKSRKDGTMSLVYNLVTQSDAANNIRLAQSMKSDSTSMSAIAALTMIFLPGTFTSSVLSAGIFTARASSQGISTSSLWWLWITLTIPLTIIVVFSWWIYRRHNRREKEVVFSVQ